TSRSNAQLLDADGNVLYDGAPGAVANNCEFEKLEEGDYTYMKKSWINYPGSEENPQILNATIHVDKTAPNVKHNYINENGRTYLVITASDDRQLQGLTVSGIGDGGEAGVYQPGNENDIRKRYFVKAMLSRSRTGGTTLKETGYENIANLPFVLRVWGDLAEQAEGDSFDFADVLAAEPDEKGNWTVKYDVTNLKNYSFTVLDEAYNFVEIRSTGNAAEELVAQKGFWAEPDHGYYMIGDNTFTYTSYWDGSVKEYSYTAFGDRLTLVSGNEKKEYTVWGLSDTNYQLKNQDDDTVIDLSRSEFIRNMCEGKKFIPEKALVEDALRQSNEYRDFEMVVTRHSLSQAGLEIVINNSDESEGFHQDYYYVNIFNGRGTLTSDLKNYCSRAVLCPEYLSEIPAGLYDYYENDDTLLRFNEDGKTGMMLVSKPNANFGIDENTPFTYTIGENGSLTFSCNDRTVNGIVTRNMDNGGIYIMFFEPKEDLLIEWYMNLITDDQEQIAKLRSFDEMRQLATAYLNAVLCEDFAPSKTQSALFDYYLGAGWTGCHIDIDPFTLDVTDNEGNTGNLLDPPKMPENAAYTMDALKDLAAASLKERTGVQAEYVKGLLRNDGSVMLLLMDEVGQRLECYIADPVTGKLTPKQKNRGDVNCDGAVDVADAVLLSRMLTADAEAVVTDEGRDNADCDLDHTLTTEDVTFILLKVAKKIRF
ncbi:MAG: dockerin type I repeat-containing protein, partial [Oscillospiraceae bacterium]|nr:dockerin type I repeat-containing protein [Oscillospiraceae bacterium]